ncbi:CBASS cGAMP synthase [Vibrio sp. YIC-376]|uniref:CBASS cGAMP synthase n=1 Tax=Vibrio sp. YIC-376 TaxID=3136162 RepID=UPI00402A8D5B
MKWNINRFLNNPSNGVISELAISESDFNLLVSSRKNIRSAIRETFSNIRSALRSRSYERRSKLISVLPEDVADAILMLEPGQQTMIGKLRPVFFTQGSFTYGTLNRPAYPPKQQLDLDDGVYLPIEFFESSPIVSKKVFFLIIDSVLTRLCEENPEWTGPSFKPTCARINVAPHIHIDVPLYAIPEDEYENIDKSRQRESMNLESVNAVNSYDQLYTNYFNEIFNDAASEKVSSYSYLDPNKIYLAKRDDEEHWIPSDPAQVARWFKTAVKEHGRSLVNACRYLKAWRDTTYPTGGPTSLTLMACAVTTLDNHSQTEINDHSALLLCTKALPKQLRQGVSSPDPSDTRDLFPKPGMDQDEVDRIIEEAEKLLNAINHSTYQATSIDESKSSIVSGIGVHAKQVPAKLIEETNLYSDVISTPVSKKPPREVPNLRSGTHNE